MTAGRKKKQLSPQWNVLQGMFTIKCLPSETTGRICLAVSCWMAACVCFWKTSLASHLQGSSTTSTFTSSPGESKFHMSVTDRVESEKAHKIPPATLHFPQLNWRSRTSRYRIHRKTFQDKYLIFIYHCPFATTIRQLQSLNSIILPDNCPTNATVKGELQGQELDAPVGCDVVKPCSEAKHKLHISFEAFTRIRLEPHHYHSKKKRKSHICCRNP